jgi:thiamine transport system substrate-binding protein
MLKYNSRFIILLLAVFVFAACQGAAATPTNVPTASAPTRAPSASIPTTVVATVAATSAPTAGATSAATASATEAPTEAPAPTETLGPGFTDLILVTHDSFAASEEVIQEFEKANHARVQVLKSGDAGAALNKEILAGATNPLGDAFFGVDNTFLSRAIKANIFEPYKPQGIDNVPNAFRLDPEYRLNPIDYGDVCLNYDIDWFKGKNIAPPQNLEDLTKPQYKSLLVVENPATSSPGLAFLLATVAHFGESKYLEFWKQLRANDVAVSDGWEDAYYNRFTFSGKGDRPIVVSYATSPAAEVFFSNGKYTEPPTGNVSNDESCFRQIEFAGVLKGAKHADLARKFIDYMLDVRFQSDVPSQMFVYPVNPNAKLPDFFKFALQVRSAAQLPPEQIDANRDKWINAWTQVVLR